MDAVDPKRFRLRPEVEKQLLKISALQIDPRLKSAKTLRQRRIYGRTKPGYLLKHDIPVKTDRWDVQSPGFTEVDLVSHSGNSASREFAYTLNVTDMHKTWTESGAVLGRGEEVRKRLGWERYDTPEAVEAINDLYRQELRLWMNLPASGSGTGHPTGGPQKKFGSLTNGLTGAGGAKKEHASTLQRSHIDAGAEDVTVHGLSYLCLSRAAWRTQHLIECVQRE